MRNKPSVIGNKGGIRRAVSTRCVVRSDGKSGFVDHDGLLYLHGCLIVSIPRLVGIPITRFPARVTDKVLPEIVAVAVLDGSTLNATVWPEVAVADSVIGETP